MLGRELQHSLRQLLRATVDQSIERFSDDMRKVRTTMASKGMLRSSHHVHVLDKTSAEILQEAATAMLGHVRDVDGAQPSESIDQRFEAITAEFLNEATRLHRALTTSVASQIERMGLDPIRLAANARADGALSDVQATMPARIRTIITGNSNAVLKGAAMTTTTNHNVNLTVTDSMIGNVQTGAGAIGIASQTSQASVPESVLRAFADVLEDIARSDISEKDRTELAEVVGDLRSEVQKSAPNKRRLKGLLEVGADVAALVPVAQGAWDLVKNYIGPLTGSS